MKHLLLSLCLLFSLFVGVSGQEICSCEIPTASRVSRLAAADQALTNAPASEAQILAKRFPFGLPRAAADASGETMLLQLEWVTWYDNDLRVPLWVGYELNKADAKAKVFPR